MLLLHGNGGGGAGAADDVRALAESTCEPNNQKQNRKKKWMEQEIGVQSQSNAVVECATEMAWILYFHRKCIAFVEKHFVVCFVGTSLESIAFLM